MSKSYEVYCHTRDQRFQVEVEPDGAYQKVTVTFAPEAPHSAGRFAEQLPKGPYRFELAGKDATSITFHNYSLAPDVEAAIKRTATAALMDIKEVQKQESGPWTERTASGSVRSSGRG